VPPSSAPLRWPGYLLGFALGGFFDGILLHQILEWHHLLSLVEGVDLRAQLLSDGLFHALMYLIALIGLAMLFRSRRFLAEKGTGRALIAAVLIGFGLWHVVDAVASHWLLGIHRIKLNSASPLLWDLVWFVTFGLLPLVAGMLTLRGRTHVPGRPAALGLAAAAMIGGSWAARPPADSNTTIAVFRPDMSDGQVINAVAESGGRLLWQSRGVWAVRWADEGKGSTLYRSGALFVSSSALGAGCLAWTQA
jgi:uncharacterized membrane protein